MAKRSKKKKKRHLDVREYDRIANAQKLMPERQITKCQDCGVAPGQRHQPGCDVERCPLCKGQLITCGCVYAINGMDRSKLDVEHPDIYKNGATEEMWAKFDAEVEKHGGFEPWSGEWPGVAECRERGWYCQDDFPPHPRYGSFCPCPPDAPGASEDLNRLAHYNRWGLDNLYDGCKREPRTGPTAEVIAKIHRLAYEAWEIAKALPADKAEERERLEKLSPHLHTFASEFCKKMY